MSILEEIKNDALELCYQIERLEASEGATRASVLASALHDKIVSALKSQTEAVQ